MKVSDSEWAVMEVLWSGEAFSLGEVRKVLRETRGWSRNTVYTYLIRMEGKGMVRIERGSEKPYRAEVSREVCARKEREELLDKVYGGAVGELITAFLKESRISAEERERLKKLLDEMEV